jgi:hypothetical protein
MSAPATDNPAYQQYLAEANAEIDAMLAPASTPDPVSEAPARHDPLLKVVMVALVAVAVLVLGMILFRGRGPVRSMA